MRFPFLAILTLCLISSFSYAESDDPSYGDDKNAVVPLYKESDLIQWFASNRHLAQVKKDDCQLVQDIEARARIVGSPAYQFLWGDLAHDPATGSLVGQAISISVDGFNTVTVMNFL